MGEIVVKHFKRSGAGSDNKELITEIVVESSDTSRFLRRMEESRLTRPCYQTIDMRGRVAGECHPYAFNDRVHYLDEISFQLFEQGLREYNGIYTVATFEAIIGGVHTLRAQQTVRREAEKRCGEVEKRRPECSRATRVDRQTGLSGDDAPAVRTDNPALLSLGYFRRRRHPRLQYACAVVLERGNIRTNGVTRDISVCGAQLRVRGLTTFKRNQEVLLSYSGLKNEAGRTNVTNIAYRVVSCKEHDEETVLCLHRQANDGPAGFSAFLESFIERYQSRYKLDVDDEYRSILSWYYERCYAQSSPQIPFFVEQSDDSGLRIQGVAMSEGNSQLARFFCTDVDNYNFTPLCLPQRLQQLQQKHSFVMAMYRRRGEQDRCLRIHSAADFEFSSQYAFHDMVSYTRAQPDHCIVKVHVSQVPAISVSEQKLDEVSQRLQSKSGAQLLELHERLQKLRFVAYIVDVTQDFQRLAERSAEPGDEGAEPAVWVGCEQRGLASGAVKARLSMSAEDVRPELIRFGYVERRREDRYLAETGVVVGIGSNVYQGLSKDISTRGMRIQLHQRVDVKKGVSVKVGLVSLQQKKPGADLMDIPYRVVQIRDEEEGTVLMLERISGAKREGLKAFFVELISRNRHKLGIEFSDIRGATASRVYEALLAVNTPSVPFFLARNGEGGAHLQFVGVPESGSPLLDWFSSASGVDFRCLNERRVVTALYDAVQILLRQSRRSDETPTPFEVKLYLYKELDELTGETSIRAASDLDFSSDIRLEAFLTNFVGYTDWRCVKIISTFAQSVDEKALDRMVDTLRSRSKHRAIKLSDLAHSLVGYGELIDITDEWSSLRTAGAPS